MQARNISAALQDIQNQTGGIKDPVKTANAWSKRCLPACQGQIVLSAYKCQIKLRIKFCHSISEASYIHTSRVVEL